jgi:type IV secretory pathway TrbD component
MKVIRKTENVPISLMVIGSAMAVASQSGGLIDDNRDILFIAGWILAGVGILVWAIPAILKYMKKKERERMKSMKRVQSDDDQVRRYARPRR